MARDLHAASPESTSGVAPEPPLPFIEVYIDIPLAVAEERDPKGLYKKARAGTIPHFTGISAPYEAPEQPEIHLRTDQLSVEECVGAIVRYLEDKELVPRAMDKGRAQVEVEQ